MNAEKKLWLMLIDVGQSSSPLPLSRPEGQRSGSVGDTLLPVIISEATHIREPPLLRVESPSRGSGCDVERKARRKREPIRGRKLQEKIWWQTWRCWLGWLGFIKVQYGEELKRRDAARTWFLFEMERFLAVIVVRDASFLCRHLVVGSVAETAFKHVQIPCSLDTCSFIFCFARVQANSGFTVWMWPDSSCDWVVSVARPNWMVSAKPGSLFVHPAGRLLNFAKMNVARMTLDWSFSLLLQGLAGPKGEKVCFSRGFSHPAWQMSFWFIPCVNLHIKQEA